MPVLDVLIPTPGYNDEKIFFIEKKFFLAKKFCRPNKSLIKMMIDIIYVSLRLKVELHHVSYRMMKKNVFMLHRTHHNSQHQIAVFLSYLKFYTFSPFIKIFIIFCGFSLCDLNLIFICSIPPISSSFISFGVEIVQLIWDGLFRLLPYIPMTAFHASYDT